MGFDSSFERVIWSRVRSDRELADAAKSRICEHGQADFGDFRVVACYCMCYMHQHFDANLAILRQNAAGPIFTDPDAVVIDFGCGPGTAALVLATRNRELGGQPARFSYLGIDRSTMMHEVATNFLSDNDLFHCGAQRVFFQAARDVPVALAAGKTAALFYCSYVLNQTHLADTDVRDFADVICGIKALGIPRGHLIVSDVNRGQPTNYMRLGRFLRNAAVGITLDIAQYRNYSEGIASNRRSPRVVGDFFPVEQQVKKNVAYAIQQLW
ncbi:MAG TPA: class I SAM-dependent methyltransferase [Candidatus Baltobacteraceae bacterium]|nr:class I SAM-dependent methyltransferase [Candidatus Baltobacteraceae bacterium]